MWRVIRLGWKVGPIPMHTSSSGHRPPGTSNAGDYHTHGKNDRKYDNEIFSDRDKDANDSEKRPGFLGTPSGDIKVYLPIPGKPRGGDIIFLGTGAK